MQIKFDRAAFVTAIKWALGGIDPKIPGVGVELVPNESGEVLISGASTSMENTATITGAVEDDTDLTSVCLSADFLKKSIDRFLAKEIVLSTVEDSGSSIKLVSGISVKVPEVANLTGSVDDDNLLEKELKNYTKLGTLDPRDLVEAVKRLSPLTDSDSAELFSALDFDFKDDGKITIMATDKYAFSTRTINYTAEEYHPTRFLITASDVNLISSAKDAQTVDVYEKNPNEDGKKTAVMFVFDNGMSLRVNTFPTEPFDYSSLVCPHRDNEESFVVSAKELMNLATTAASLAETNTDIHIRVSDVGAELWNKDETVHAPLTVTNVSFTGARDFLFQYAILNETLAAANEDSIKVKFVSTTDKVVWSQLTADGDEDESVYILNVPMRIVD